MLKQQARLINSLTVLGDMLLLLLAFVLAYSFRGYFFAGSVGSIYDYAWILLPALPIWYLLLSHNGLYRSIRHYSSSALVVRLFSVHVFAGMALASIILFLDREHYSRGLFFLFVAFSFSLVATERLSARFILGVIRRRGYNFRNCLIVGTHAKASRFIDLIEKHADWGLRVTGLLQVAEGELKSDVNGYSVFGRLQELERVCKDYPVDEVVFCIDKDLVVDVEEQLQILQDLGLTVRMVLDFFTLERYQRDLSFFHDHTPILTFHLKSLDAQQLLIKRTMDIAGALVGLLIAAAVFPFVALSINLVDPGPIFFSQWRIGESGRRFRIWKFRSMYIDAEKRKEELRGRNEMNGAIFKIKNDPRITPIGILLRKTSLDEFPQFWNVLKGEMSLVGTRPPTPDEVEQYENWQRRRITIKPGITGMWQVNGRNRIDDFDEIVKLDLRYIDNWNIWLDIRILFKTLWVVLARQGSC